MNTNERITPIPSEIAIKALTKLHRAAMDSVVDAATVEITKLEIRSYTQDQVYAMLKFNTKEITEERDALQKAMDEQDAATTPPAEGRDYPQQRITVLTARVEELEGRNDKQSRRIATIRKSSSELQVTIAKLSEQVELGESHKLTLVERLTTAERERGEAIEVARKARDGRKQDLRIASVRLDDKDKIIATAHADVVIVDLLESEGCPLVHLVNDDEAMSWCGWGVVKDKKTTEYDTLRKAAATAAMGNPPDDDLPGNTDQRDLDGTFVDDRGLPDGEQPAHIPDAGKKVDKPKTCNCGCDGNRHSTWCPAFEYRELVNEDEMTVEERDEAIKQRDDLDSAWKLKFDELATKCDRYKDGLRAGWRLFNGQPVPDINGKPASMGSIISVALNPAPEATPRAKYCPECGGTGQVIPVPGAAACRVCRGTGKAPHPAPEQEVSTLDGFARRVGEAMGKGENERLAQAHKNEKEGATDAG